jgi:hypothetical protein
LGQAKNFITRKTFLTSILTAGCVIATVTLIPSFVNAQMADGQGQNVNGGFED